jgi:hypothetical protein
MVLRLPEVDTNSGTVCVYAVAQALPVVSAAVRAGEQVEQVLPRFRCIAGGDRYADFVVGSSGMVEQRETGAAALLRQVPFLEDLPSSALDLVIARLHTDEYFPRTMLVEQGAKADRMIIINKGKAEIIKQEPSGLERSMGFVAEGEIFGATEMTMNIPSKVGLRCVTVVQASILLRRDLILLMARDASIAELLRGYGF